MEQPKLMLNYEPKRPRRLPSWLRPAIGFLWSLVLLNLYAIAIIAPIFAVLGFINFFHPISGLSQFGRPVITTADKIEWEIHATIWSVVFVPLAVWHCRRVLRRQRDLISREAAASGG